MKKLIKILIAGAVLLTTGFSAFAQSSKLTKVESNKIIVVGKINVFYDEDREFIFKTRGVDENLIDNPDTYVVPYIYDTNDTFGSSESKYLKENQTEYPIGDFFMVQYNIPKKGDKVLKFRYRYEMYYFGSKNANLHLLLPAWYDVDIPDGVDALYLGTFNYYITGDNFTIDAIERVDEFDLAQEELDRCLGTHVDMARAVLKVIEDE
ncbi:MAG: hypothetical protein J5726_07965 [Treponema sp.]|nr:hypothetical protein [Treponema sp.]